MPGFVDVSNMTSEEVRRMGHADDYDEVTNRMSYRNPYAYRKPVKQVPKPALNFNTDDVFAASAAAFRINGSYVKAIAPGIEGQKTNRMIVEELLADPTKIGAEDREQGEIVRRYYKAFTFKVIEGKSLNDFTKTAMMVADRDVVTSRYDLAVIVSLPASYEKNAKRDNVDRRIKWAQGGFIGTPGDKVELTIEVVKQLWSQNWNTWYLTGITDQDQVVFFSFKKQIDIGSKIKIQGKVKGHRDSSTQLSHVKEIK